MRDPSRRQREERRASVPKLSLPSLDERSLPGSRFVHQVGVYTLTAVVLGSGLAIAGAMSIELDIGIPVRGFLEPVQVWDVHSPEAGIIDRVLVRTGESVRAGQPLLTLEASGLRQRHRELEVEREVAEVSYREAKAVLDRAEREGAARIAAAEASLAETTASLRVEMMDFGAGGNTDSIIAQHELGTHATFDGLVAKARQARAALEAERMNARSAESLALERRRLELEANAMALEALRNRIDQFTIRAPADGVLLGDEVKRLEGSYAEAGRRLFGVAASGSWQAKMLVGERDVHRIHIDDPVRLEIQPLKEGGRAWHDGSVTFVSSEPLGVADSGDVIQSVPAVYRVLARIDGLDGLDATMLRHGYSLEARVIVDRGTVAELLWRALGRRREQVGGPGS